MALGVDDIALKWQLKPNGRIEADRAVIFGSAGYGKSTLATVLVRHWQRQFCDPRIPFDQRGRILISDEKPRYRASHSVIGPPTRKRYKDFVKGDTIRGVVLDDPAHWDLVWNPNQNPWQTVIAQAPEREEDWVVWVCQRAIDRLFETQHPNRPTLSYIDEGLSFFGPTGLGKQGSGIQRSYRAGREKGLASLLGSQRPKQISPQTKTEANVVFAFRMNSAKDTRDLADDLGLEPPPYDFDASDKYRFWAWRDAELMSHRPLMLPRSAAA